LAEYANNFAGRPWVQLRIGVWIASIVPSLGVTDTGSSYTQYGGTIIVSKALAAASANNISLSQIPAASTPLLLNGTTGGTLDTGRRVIITAGSEAAQRTIVINGLTSQGAPISETITIPSGTAGVYPSARDYLVVTSITSPAAFTAAVTIGTNAVGSTAWFLPSHYGAEFGVGCQLSVPTGGVASVECTRDVPYAAPAIYQSGMGIMPPICDAFAWPTLSGVVRDQRWRTARRRRLGMTAGRGTRRIPTHRRLFRRYGRRWAKTGGRRLLSRIAGRARHNLMRRDRIGVGAGEAVGDVDSPVAAIRLTVTAGTGRVTLRLDPLGLRT